jgi:hypothetical protein
MSPLELCLLSHQLFLDHCVNDSWGYDVNGLPRRSTAKVSLCGLRQELICLKAIILRPKNLRSPNEAVGAEAGKQPGQLLCA